MISEDWSAALVEVFLELLQFRLAVTHLADIFLGTDFFSAALFEDDVPFKRQWLGMRRALRSSEQAVALSLGAGRVVAEGLRVLK